jgi:DNA polymerase-3 subunit delta
MFGDTKLIRIDGAGDECADAAVALLGAEAAGNPVIMIAGALKATSTLLKAALASPLALAFQCYAPDARAASAMVADACAAHGMRPTREALALLTANFGGERGVLARELEKLALYLDASPGSETVLDSDALAAIGTAISDADFGGLVDALASGNIAETERQAAKLDRNGITGIPQLRAAARRLWMLAELRTSIDAGRSAREAVEAYRPPVFWKDRDAVMEQAGFWTDAALRNALARILETERRIKASGSAPADLLTSHCLIAIARTARSLKRR